MSTEHDCTVIKIGPIAKHPDADALSITEVDGRPCIIRTGEWAEGDIAVYVPIDSVVPTRDARFAFLASKAKSDGSYRVRAMRLRGVFSMGLLIRPTEDDLLEAEGIVHTHGLIPDFDRGLPAIVGVNLRAHLGITVYEGPEEGNSIEAGQMERDPGFLPVYDIESLRKWQRVLADGEEVVLTEKVHGANGRFAFHQGRLWVATRTTYRKPVDELGEGSMWSKVAADLDLERRLSAFPGFAVYGEVYGQVQDLKYGVGVGGRGARLVVFDILEIATRRWLDYDEQLAMAAAMGLPTVPMLYRGPWSPELMSHAEGATVLGNGAHVREGFVLRPVKERVHLRLGRVLLKMHGQGYLLRKGG